MSHTPSNEERDLLEQLRRVVSSREPKLAKAEPRDRHREDAHKQFRAGVDALTLEHWSFRRIARTLDCDVSMVSTWYHYGNQPRNQIPGWALTAITRLARNAVVREILGWSELPPPSRTGTDDV